MAIKPGTRVKIHTTTGGCYDGKTGVVTGWVSSTFWYTDDENLVAWHRVQFDDGPADNGGQPIGSELFQLSELTVID